MILVDIFVPAVDQNYNFSLNEDVDVSVIIKEVVGMISKKEQMQLQGKEEELLLYSQQDKRVLPKGNSLSECMITTGSSLLLV